MNSQEPERSKNRYFSRGNLFLILTTFTPSATNKEHTKKVYPASGNKRSEQWFSLLFTDHMRLPHWSLLIQLSSGPATDRTKQIIKDILEISILYSNLY